MCMHWGGGERTSSSSNEWQRKMPRTASVKEVFFKRVWTVSKAHPWCVGCFSVAEIK